MDGPRDYHIKWGIKANTNYHLHVESKIWHKWTYLRNRNRLTDIENKLMVTKGEIGGGDKSRVWDWQMQANVYKTEKQQGPTV